VSTSSARLSSYQDRRFLDAVTNKVETADLHPLNLRLSKLPVPLYFENEAIINGKITHINVLGAAAVAYFVYGAYSIFGGKDDE
jgi:hypothetical protein